MVKDTDYGTDKVNISYAEIGEMERHILSLQSFCRLLASFWLWANFAGMAYVLTENLNLHISNELIFLGINTATLLGICMLWLLDLLVYHRQLVWIMAEGRYLEGKYNWLPKLRKFRYALLCHDDSSPRVIWYYFLQAVVLMLIGAASLAAWLYRHQPAAITSYTTLYIIIVSLLIIIVYIITDNKVPINPKDHRKPLK